MHADDVVVTSLLSAVNFMILGGGTVYACRRRRSDFTCVCNSINQSINQSINGCGIIDVILCGWLGRLFVPTCHDSIENNSVVQPNECIDKSTNARMNAVLFARARTRACVTRALFLHTHSGHGYGGEGVSQYCSKRICEALFVEGAEEKQYLSVTNPNQQAGEGHLRSTRTKYIAISINFIFIIFYYFKFYL